MLADSAHLQEKKPNGASRHRDTRRRHPMTPLYNVNQARACLETAAHGRLRD